MSFATDWFCLACGARFRESSGWPCPKCHEGVLLRFVVKDKEPS